MKQKEISNKNKGVEMERIINRTKAFWLNKMVVVEIILSVLIMYVFTYKF